MSIRPTPLFLRISAYVYVQLSLLYRYTFFIRVDLRVNTCAVVDTYHGLVFIRGAFLYANFAWIFVLNLAVAVISHGFFHAIKQTFANKCEMKGPLVPWLFHNRIPIISESR